MLRLASRIKLPARACARALERQGDFLTMFDGLLQPPPQKAKLSSEGHTHLKKKRMISRDHRVNLARLHASSTIAELERVSEIPSILHGTY